MGIMEIKSRTGKGKNIPKKSDKNMTKKGGKDGSNKKTNTVG